MPKGQKPEGRVALCEFFWFPSGPRPLDFMDFTVYRLTLREWVYTPLFKEASETVREAGSFIFPRYEINLQHAHPTLLGREPGILVSILVDLSNAGVLKGSMDVLTRRVRPVPAKYNLETNRAVIVSGASEVYWPNPDPFDVDWEKMPLDEKVLRHRDYASIKNHDPEAFIKAFGLITKPRE